MPPVVDDEYESVVHGFELALGMVLSLSGTAKVRPGVKLSDRRDDWKQNFRALDVALYLHDIQTDYFDPFCRGGPDFAVEVVSREDCTREKLDFCAKGGVRELLIVDRDPWQLELLRLHGEVLKAAGTSTDAQPNTLTSEVIPFTFRLQHGEKRPAIRIAHAEIDRSWNL